MKTFGIRLHRHGGPEVMEWEEYDLPPLAPGQALLRHTAVGLNFIDVYQRTGLYPQIMPFIPGSEASGVVEALGEGVINLAIGDRVAYAGVAGAYCEHRIIAADRLVKLPDTVDDHTAAAMMLQGMTVQYLIRRTYRVQPGDTILIHAAAGGIGLILCQWAKSLGATIIGTVSSREKADLAKSYGCTYPVVADEADFVAQAKELTNGAGLPIVYDSIGKDTFFRSLDCLRPLGTLVLFGQSSGAVPPIDPNILARGSYFLTRPSLGAFIAKRADLEATAGELLSVVESGAVKIVVNQTYPLRDAGRAQSDLEARKTTGSTVLTV
ncbi:quinone oxidoreductase [Acidisphaera sp. L21]|jgi:NADPH2:quinone reductase|uniref:quinone oxidoreductase family protein n=1 Tax=Acidisphaera sp. L21 TaxID=1641851 RepID=UPI00131AD3A7|nr:quinone oxidoreductase [Acidisphaera sp. L21]